MKINDQEGQIHKLKSKVDKKLQSKDLGNRNIEGYFEGIDINNTKGNTSVNMCPAVVRNPNQ